LSPLAPGDGVSLADQPCELASDGPGDWSCYAERKFFDSEYERCGPCQARADLGFESELDYAERSGSDG